MAKHIDLPKLFLALIDSNKWKPMQDFQKGWLWQLMLRMCYTKTLGRLPDDGHLWTHAGALSRGYWDANSQLVMAHFQAAQIDGKPWIVHLKLQEMLLRASQDKEKKGNQQEIHKKTDEKILDIFNISYIKYPRKVKKPSALKAFVKAIDRVAKERQCSLYDAAEFIVKKVAEYAAFCERVNKQKQFIPHMATWLNADGFNDDYAEMEAFERQHSNSNSGTKRRIITTASNFGGAATRLAGASHANGGVRKESMAPAFGCVIEPFPVRNARNGNRPMGANPEIIFPKRSETGD